MKHGIDISEHNGNIDIQSLHPDFVIIRAGYGHRYTDKYLFRNVKECERLNIPYGLYWFSEALNTEESQDEAIYFLNLIKNLNPKVGVWLDMEDSTWKTNNGWSKTSKNVTAICEAFCDIVQMEGYYTGIYCNKYYFDNLVKTRRFDFWIAWWNHEKNTQNIGSMLQYTDKLGGMNLDGNVCYADLKTYDVNYLKDRHKKLIHELAERTINGEFGNGEDRKKILGVIYSEVQSEVNKMGGKK